MPPTPPQRQVPAAWRRALGRGLILAAILGVAWYCHWLVKAGKGYSDWGDFDYYRLLVRGFQKGQLSLDHLPSPEMLALADPYDPAQNASHRLPDASYFKGRYYLYFGPTPAVTLMWPYVALTGREIQTGTAIVIFWILGFLAGSGLWLALRRRYFHASPAWLAAAGVVAVGMGTHLLALAHRPMWWELAIAGGFAFTMLGLVAAYRAMQGGRPVLAMACAGLCLGLAGASRPPCYFAVGLLLPPLWFAWRRGGCDGTWWRMACAGAAALGVCILAVLAYNHARFGDPLEFGQAYQLSGHHGKLELFKPRFIPHNLMAYFLNPPQWTWEFPFVSARPRASSLPGYFGAEGVVGLGLTCVFVWFALALPLAWRRRETAESVGLGAVLASIGAVVVGPGVLICSMFSNTARYAVDFMPAVGLLALVGALGLDRWARARGRGVRWAVRLLMGGAFAVTALMGVLISLDYHGRSIRRSNPSVWEPLERRVDAWLSSTAVAAGALPGAREIEVRFQARPPGTVETFWRATDPRAEEQIVVEHVGERAVRFGYARGTEPLRWGHPESWTPDQTHTIRLQLPSLYGPPDGWLSGLRRNVEFRERTSLGVSLISGRNFGMIVPPLPAGIIGGGEVPREFSGEVRSVRRRVFSEREFLGREEAAIRPRADGQMGGTLVMKVQLPDRLAAAGEPLLAAGALYGSDMVYLREVDNGGVRILFEHFGPPPLESAPFTLDRTREHVFEIEWASFAPDRFGATTEGEVVVRVNGQDALQTRSSFHDFPDEHPVPGRNPFGTTCAPQFRGWVIDAAWRER